MKNNNNYTIYLHYTIATSTPKPLNRILTQIAYAANINVAIATAITIIAIAVVHSNIEVQGFIG